MDFIERWFGIAPDGGSGMLETSLIIVGLIVLAAPFIVVRLRSRAHRPPRTS
jgi:hypothetical protein